MGCPVSNARVLNAAERERAATLQTIGKECGQAAKVLGNRALILEKAAWRQAVAGREKRAHYKMQEAEQLRRVAKLLVDLDFISSPDLPAIWTGNLLTVVTPKPRAAKRAVPPTPPPPPTKGQVYRLGAGWVAGK